MAIQGKDIITLHRATKLAIWKCKAALIESDGNILVARQVLERETQAIGSKNDLLKRKEELPLKLLEQLEILNTRLSNGLISIDQVKLFAHLKCLPTSILITDLKLRENGYSNDQSDLGNWIYGLSIAGTRVLVHVCLVFSKLSLDAWSNAEEQDWKGFKYYQSDWFRQGKNRRENRLRTFFSAVQLAKLWHKQPNDKALEQVISIEPNLSEYFREIEFWESEGDCPDEMLEFAAVIYFMIAVVTWDSKHTSAGITDPEEQRAIAQTGPAYETVECISHAKSALKMQAEDVRHIVRDCLLPWAIGTESELSNLI